jgi:hypothetical protein
MKRIIKTTMLLITVLAMLFGVIPQVSATVYTDPMDSGWTFTFGGPSPPSATIIGGYSNLQYTSAPTSIRAFVKNGGTDGRDGGSVLATKDFPITKLDRLKVNYYIAQQTDVADSWGGMAALAEAQFTLHYDDGTSLTYGYIVAGSETSRGQSWSNNFCEARARRHYVDQSNTIIPAPGDAELEPPTGIWYTLDRNINTDFSITWCGVTQITLGISHVGGYMYLDTFETYWDDLEIEGSIYECPELEADVEIHPETLNAKSKGKWVTCIIELPEAYDHMDIDPAMVYLEGDIPAEKPVFTGHSLNVKFDRGALIEKLSPGEAQLTVTVTLTDGTSFSGYDKITFTGLE